MSNNSKDEDQKSFYKSQMKKQNSLLEAVARLPSYQQSLNFKMSEIEPLKIELSQTKANSMQRQQSTSIVKEVPNTSIKQLATEMSNQRHALEQLAMRVLELEKIKTAQPTEVFEFQQDSITVMPANEVEAELRKQVEELKAQLMEREQTNHAEDLEQQLHVQSIVSLSYPYS
jgi:hypothetical protein